MPLNMNDGGGRIKGVLAASVTLAVAVAVAQPDPLAERFANPPAECALQAWWHWVSDCVTEEGTGIYTWSNWLDGWHADDALLPAGLLGPVAVRGCFAGEVVRVD